MAKHPVPDLAESITIEAPPARVWALVSDPAHYPRWSPMTARTLVRGRPVGVGSHLLNLNRHGWRAWPTTGKVTEFEDGRRIAFRITENWSTWSYSVAPEGSGTQLTVRRDAPQGISGVSTFLTRRVLGGESRFTDLLRTGMRETLAAVKRDAEA